MITLGIPFTSALNWRLMEKSTAFSTPWSVAAYWRAQEQNSSSATTGLYIYDGTKLEGIEILQISASPYVEIRVEQIPSVTATTGFVTVADIPLGFYSAAPGTNQLAMPTPMLSGLCLRWRDNGTTLFADYSLDCANWSNISSESVGSFITPTAYGFGGSQNASGGSQFPSVIDLMGWLETNSATL